MFAYCLNNPVYFVDSSGDEAVANKVHEFSSVGGGGALGLLYPFVWIYDTVSSCLDSISFSKKKQGDKEKEKDQPEPPEVTFPGKEPEHAPGEDFEWRGKKPVGGDKGAWVNLKTGEQWHPDLNHKLPKGPHWDYTDIYGVVWAVFENGEVKIW